MSYKPMTDKKVERIREKCLTLGEKAWPLALNIQPEEWLATLDALREKHAKLQEATKALKDKTLLALSYLTDYVGRDDVHDPDHCDGPPVFNARTCYACLARSVVEDADKAIKGIPE